MPLTNKYFKMLETGRGFLHLPLLQLLINLFSKISVDTYVNMEGGVEYVVLWFCLTEMGENHNATINCTRIALITLPGPLPIQ